MFESSYECSIPRPDVAGEEESEASRLLRLWEIRRETDKKLSFQPFVEERDPVIYNAKIQIDRNVRNLPEIKKL